jgi:hypothetical protein
MTAASNNQYVAVKPSERPCEGLAFDAAGFPEECAEVRVFELRHSNTKKIYLCEYHIQCYWNFWPTFRDAVRDVWRRRTSKLPINDAGHQVELPEDADGLMFELSVELRQQFIPSPHGSGAQSRPADPNV